MTIDSKEIIHINGYQVARLIVYPTCLPNPTLEILHHFGHVQLFVTPWTVACQAPLSMGFSRQEYWSGPDTPGSPEGNTEGPGTASSEPLLPS